MKTRTIQKGPLLHRVFIGACSVLLTVLFIWLLGFIARDIDRLPGPSWDQVEREHLSEEAMGERDRIARAIQQLEGRIQTQRDIQANLQESTRASQQTMNQLIETHRLNMQQGVTPTAEEQEAMAESQAQFLANQRRFQEANQAIGELSEDLRGLQLERAELDESLEQRRVEARQVFDQQRRAHSWKTAALKLGFLVPLLLVTAWWAVRIRTSPYAPIAYAACVAAFWRVGWTMHQHFPREYFKYLAIATAIVVVLAALVRLIRMVAQPQTDWLLRQRREAYARRVCPVCAYGFQGVRGQVRSPQMDEEHPYSCPSCGTNLFGPCSACGQVRHTLLPYCEHCGAAEAEE